MEMYSRVSCVRLRVLMLFSMGLTLVQGTPSTGAFGPVAGRYAGLFYESGGLAQTNSGLFTAKITGGGALSAKLQFAAGSYSLSGQFLADGSYTHSITRRGSPPMTVRLRLELNGGDTISGTISNFVWLAELQGNRLIYHAKTNPAPQGGKKYTLYFPGNGDGAQLPGGHGFVALSVSAAGAVRLRGTLGEGTKLTASTFVSKTGQWPLYARLYSGKGQIAGWLVFTNNPNTRNELEGRIGWIKPSQKAARVYRDGFYLPYGRSANAFGSVYANANGTALLPWSTGTLILMNGNLSRAITNGITLTANGRGAGTNQLTLKVNAASGFFTGSINRQDGTAETPFSGVLVQKHAAGYGCFLGTDESGSVTFFTEGPWDYPLDHWTWRNSLLPGSNLAAIYYGKGAFVAVGENGIILSSCDRATWTLRQSGTSNSLSSITYGGGRFVTVGGNQTILTSDDGSIWSRCELLSETQRPPFYLQTVVYGGGRFVAMGSSRLGNVVLSSTNGVDWLYGHLAGNGSVQGLAYGDGQFVAVCYRDWYGSSIYTSTDGMSWSRSGDGPMTFEELHSLVYGNGIFVAVGTSGLVMTSPDGRTWTKQTSGLTTAVTLVGLAYGYGEFVAISTGPLFSSFDGSNWITHASSPEQLRSVTYVGSRFMGVGINGRILESDPIRMPLEAKLDAMGFQKGSFQFAVTGSCGQSYLVQASTNLSDWTPLLDVVATNSPYQVEDSHATDFALRFYRAVVP